MIDARSIQRALIAKGFYGGAVDGDIGPASRLALRQAVVKTTALPSAADWPPARILVAFQQIMMRDVGIDVGAIDGLAGPQTAFGLEKWQDYLRDVDAQEEEVAHQPKVWPRQKDVPAVFGKPGRNHAQLVLPYPMRIAWDKGETVNSFAINAKVRDSAQRVYTRVHGHYGEQRIRDLGLDLFGGCYNNRKMRGGSNLSMHAFAVAIDHDPERNQLRWGRDRADFAKPAYDAWWRFWEDEGWVSLGRERNCDWMHVQAARL
jgi:hypothetical protein